MTTTHWRDFWGDQGDRPNPYGSRDPIYAEGYHRGEDVANNGSVEFVPVLRDGVIVLSGYSWKIGSFVVVKPDRTLFNRAEYDGYCHLYGPVMLRAGRVTAGDLLTRTAGARENPGTSWGGPHLHFTVTEHPNGVYDIGYVDYNPNPVIDAALRGEFTARPSVDEVKPFPTPVLLEEEDDDMDKCLIIMRGVGEPEWSLVGATVPGGLRVTKDQKTANAWAVLYGKAQVVDSREEYVRVQSESIELNKAWSVQQKAIRG